jgi:hypothetical protein
METLVIEYILCYATSFFLGMMTTVVILYGAVVYLSKKARKC